MKYEEGILSEHKIFHPGESQDEINLKTDGIRTASGMFCKQIRKWHARVCDNHIPPADCLKQCRIFAE